MTTNELPANTDHGIICGHCSYRGHVVRHANVSAIRRCWAVREDWAAEAEAEHRAELAVERFFEERGYEEARAQERWEAEMGIPV